MGLPVRSIKAVLKVGTPGAENCECSDGKVYSILNVGPGMRS